MAQYVPAIASAIAVGIGTRVAVGADFGLNFEVCRVPISLITYDFPNNKIIYKATLPVDFAATIKEIGIHSLFQDAVAGPNGFKTLTNINTGETWVQTGTTTVSTFSSSGTLLGAEGLSQTPIASATRSDSLINLNLDLSGYSGADIITFALNIGNGNTSAITIRFKTDNSNYYIFTLPSVTSGYKIVDFVKSAATITGTPDWRTITEIQLSTTSTGGGASAVLWDGINIQDTDTNNLDYVLVDRYLLSSPIVKPAGQTQDIEFSFNVTIT